MQKDIDVSETQPASSENLKAKEEGIKDGINNSNESETVSYEKYRQLLDEKKKAQAEKESILKEHNEAKKRLKEIEDAKLLEEARYKELYEAREKELAEIKERAEHEKKAFLEAKKIEAFLRATGGLKKDSYRKFIDTSKIILESSGNVDENSLQDYAASFKRDYGELLKNISTTKLPENAPKTGSTEISKMSSAEILKLMQK